MPLFPASRIINIPTAASAAVAPKRKIPKVFPKEELHTEKRDAIPKILVIRSNSAQKITSKTELVLKNNQFRETVVKNITTNTVTPKFV